VRKFRGLLAMLMITVLVVMLAACGGQSSSGGDSSSSGGSDSSNSSSSSNSSDSSSSDSSSDSKEEVWAPSRDVEFVVPYSPGGGSDTNARTIVKVINDNDLAPGINFNVVNKPGGSGAVGNAYTYNKKGDDHTIMTWVPTQSTSQLVNDADVGLKDVTPIATLALDSFLLVVNADSPYNTIEEFVEAAKASPGKLSIGGAGKGGEDHVIMYMLEKAAGIKLNYVTFNSGGETTSALLGGHIDATITNPNEILGTIQSGDARALATSSREPLEPPFTEVPTFASKGYEDVYYQQFRGIVGPPGMPQEAVDYYEGIMKKVAETSDWKENYITKNSLTSAFKGAEESEKFYEESFETTKALLKELGMIK
jgi:putative tricarboxylic transport membrane protein